MSRKTRREPKVRQISPTRLATTADHLAVEAAVARPDAGLWDKPLARHEAWNRAGAVARFCGLAYELLHEITGGLNILMQNVEAADREAQTREDFDFAMVRDLVRAASNILGDGLPDQWWDDWVTAGEELAGSPSQFTAGVLTGGSRPAPGTDVKAAAALAAPAAPAVATYRMPFLGEIDARAKPAAPAKGAALAGGAKKPAKGAALAGGHRL